MTFHVLAPFVSCVAYELFENSGENQFDEAVKAGYQEIYIVTATGIIKHQTLRPGKDGKVRFIRTPVQSVPGLQLPKFKEIKPEINFLPEGKIPMRLFKEVKAFFKEVIKKRGTAVEAMIWILWNQEKGYHLFVPNQVVSKASARYEWNSVPSGSSIIVDIHSHADFAAFFSGTDNNDDRGSIRYSGVVGHNTSAVQSTAWRFNCHPTPIECTIEDIFGEPQEEMHVPESWLEKVQTPVYTPTQYAKGTYVKGNEHAGRNDNPDRVWKGAQHGRLNRGAWSSSNSKNMSLLDDGEMEQDAHVDPDTGVITTSSSKKNRKGQKGSKAISFSANSGLIAARLLKMPGLTSEDISTLSTITNGLIRSGRGIDLNAILSHSLGSKLSDDAKAHTKSFFKAKDESDKQTSLLTEEELDGADEQVLNSMARFLSGQDVNPDKEKVEEALASYRDGEFIGSNSAFDFADNVLDYGYEAASAAADMKLSFDALSGSDDLISDLVKTGFETLTETERLNTFRELYNSLPKSAQDTLSTEGF